MYQSFPYCFWIFEFWLRKFSLYPESVMLFSSSYYMTLLFYIKTIFFFYHFYLFILATQHSFWDLGSPTGD